MKTIKTLAIGAITILTLCCAVIFNHSSASKLQTQTINSDGFAVLELFTSEGCSSCPPADELLARIQKEAANTPIYVLAYHVDYWNRLGWKDNFSKAEFSKRQYQYSNQLNAQVYTPQLVINGKSEFVGSDEYAIKSAITSALSHKSSTKLDVKAEVQGGKINVNYSVKDNSSTDQLLIALVQKNASSKVTNGENKGYTLRHVQIVHDLYTVENITVGQGKQQIAMPSNFNVNDWEVIAFLQDRQSGAITGAARSAITRSL